MVNIRINGKEYSVQDGLTVLDAAKSVGVEIPHLCYLKDINEIGACRLCCVEIEGSEKLVPACEKRVFPGMSIVTNSARVRKSARTNLELIMSRHGGHCMSCLRSGNCRLQSLCNEFGISEESFAKDLPAEEWNKDFPLQRDAEKCVKCMRCIQICDKVQGCKVWDLLSSGAQTKVGVTGGKKIESASCALCGQCITHCPTGALTARDDVSRALKAIRDPETVTVVQIAPAIRTAWGEPFGMKPGEATVNRLAAALKAAGADYVFDTSYSADLTIMEEGNEFIKRFTSGELAKYPMFTSCCPGWIRYIKAHYPELVPQLSTAKSPQQMFGAVIKTFFAKKNDIDPSKIFSISIMPCVAKKAECDMEEMKGETGASDVDLVLTTREVCRLIKTEMIDPKALDEIPFDSLMADYTGAGVIFGTTGGVMEAALRTAYLLVTGEEPPVDAFREVSSFEAPKGSAWQLKEFDMNGTTVTVAVASGLGNAGKLCDAILDGSLKADFVEIMACPGGCSGGGGQPIPYEDIELAECRGEVLRDIDKSMDKRFSHRNKDVVSLYQDMLGKPNSELAEELLHVEHII